MTNPKPRNIAVIGTGYVGLTTGACLAKLGHTVICADVLPEKVENLKKGIIPILEDGLEKLVKEGIASGRLTFVLGAKQAVKDCQFVYMCLPTPQGEDGAADLSYLLGAAEEITAELPPKTIVINKSTVPVGSAQRVAKVINRDDIQIVSNPEFLREGTAVHDFFHPDRIVIGAADQAVAQRVAELYREVDAPKVLVDTATAELIKYASNAFLATKISFANSISVLCEALGANAHKVLEGMGYDTRIGDKFLKPGPGWGGSCFPKDTYALINMAQSAGYEFGLLQAVIKSNDQQADFVVAHVLKLLEGKVKGATIGAWGLTFKAGTDDVRQSPALRILNRLTEAGANVRAYDPGVSKAPPGIHLANTALEACDGADILLVLTEWPEFSRLSLKAAAERMGHKRIVDTRNLMNLEEAEACGFEVWSVGNAGSLTSSPKS